MTRNAFLIRNQPPQAFPRRSGILKSCDWQFGRLLCSSERSSLSATDGIVGYSEVEPDWSSEVGFWEVMAADGCRTPAEINLGRMRNSQMSMILAQPNAVQKGAQSRLVMFDSRNVADEKRVFHSG